MAATTPPDTGRMADARCAAAVPHTEGVSAAIVCSARGCRRDARWQLRWRNPRLHAEDRRKIWTACDEHRGSLGDFLTARGFLREVVPLDPAASDANPGAGDADPATTDPAETP